MFCCTSLRCKSNVLDSDSYVKSCRTCNLDLSHFATKTPWQCLQIQATMCTCCLRFPDLMRMQSFVLQPHFLAFSFSFFLFFISFASAALLFCFSSILTHLIPCRYEHTLYPSLLPCILSPFHVHVPVAVYSRPHVNRHGSTHQHSTGYKAAITQPHKPLNSMCKNTGPYEIQVEAYSKYLTHSGNRRSKNTWL